MGPETHHRAVSRRFGGADRMFEVGSPPDQTHHCGWTTDCRFAARRTTASARRATGLAQPSLAARRATALDDGRTYPAGRPRPPQWTFSPLCARRVPTLALDKAKSQPKPGSVNQPAGWTATSTARPAEVWKGARDALDCEEQQHVELSANDNHIGLKKWQRPP